MSDLKKRWKEAQLHELNYVKTGRNKTWGTPHSLSYWMKFLHLDNIQGHGVEIGCGPNGIYKFAPNIVGVDPIDFSFVCDNFHQGMAENLPFGDKSVDFVICCNSLDHCMNPQKVVDEIFRVSDKLVLWTYVHPPIIAKIMLKYDRTHPFRFTFRDVTTLLEPYPHKLAKNQGYTFFDEHLKHVRSIVAKTKLVIAHILGIRGLCLHIEIITGEER